MRVLRTLTVAAAAAFSLASCSGSSVDSGCDVSGITREVEHMVGESGMRLVTLDSLRCEAKWALAKATTSGEGSGTQTSTFLFEETASGWFLRAPEIACTDEPGLPSVPDALRNDACQGL